MCGSRSRQLCTLLLKLCAYVLRRRLQVGVDVDEDALELTAANCEQFEDLHVDLLQANVETLPPGLWADTVVMCVF